MDQTNEHFNPQEDDQLAEFADQVMRGRMKRPVPRHGERTTNRQDNASPPTDNLVGLEETILRLGKSSSPNAPDEAAVKQMYVRLKARIRREEQAVKPSFWKKWFGRQFSPQLGLAFAVLVAVIVMALSIPFLAPPGSSTIGTASAPVNFFAAAGLAGVVLILFWIMRRK